MTSSSGGEGILTDRTRRSECSGGEGAGGGEAEDAAAGAVEDGDGGAAEEGQSRGVPAGQVDGAGARGGKGPDDGGGGHLGRAAVGLAPFHHLEHGREGRLVQGP